MNYNFTVILYLLQNKLSTGLSMKKKGVENLVAKWQIIQEEVKRNQK